MNRRRFSIALVACLFGYSLSPASTARAEEHQFESQVRPLLIDHCLKCHGPDKQEGGLRLDSRQAMLAGGDSGAAIAPGQAAESLILQRIEAGEMPPVTEPKLLAKQKDAIRQWLADGAPMSNKAIDAAAARDWQRHWAFQKPDRNVALATLPVEVCEQFVQGRTLAGVEPVEPNAAGLSASLQAWYRAANLELADDDDVMRWPDRSGHQRDLVPTRGAHPNGTGSPPRFVGTSMISGQPAVRFSESAGLGSPGDKPLPINGDAAYTICIVLNLKPRSGGYPHDLVVSFGEFSFAGDPGKPLAGALGIRRAPGADHQLSIVGGWGHDALLPPGSFAPLYLRPNIITITKTPGPLAASSRVFLNGQPTTAMPGWGLPSGTAGVPDLQPRQSQDFSVMLGQAVAGAGGILGDVGELLIYSAALDDQQRSGVESHLAQRYGITLPQTAVHPIDAFVDAKLRERSLTPSAPASRETLIRRAYFDLLGLPPTPEQVDRFINNPSPFAWEAMIVELLSSPQYGERSGRHWLDVARYADSGGYETDILYRQAWRYRDYVVKSLNDDKPFDRFAQEQVAGDELWPDNLDTFGHVPMSRKKEQALEAHLGTGLFVLGPQIHESNADAPLREYERLTDQVDLLGSAFLGLTLGCARCHDHKFDPLTQRDYYSLQAVFSHSREGERVLATASDIADMRQHYPRVQAVLRAKRALRQFEQALVGRSPTPEEDAQRQRLLAEIGQRVLEIPENSAQGKAFDGLLEIPTALVLEHQRPELVKPVYWLARGELNMPRDRMDAGLPTALSEATQTDRDLPDGLTSRKSLALWLTRPDHPLTARVIVNRVWQWHFGTGLVSTPNDFGRMGQAPSHPELLDWLAADFVSHGWSLMRLHMRIMTSDAYQRDSKFASPRHLEVDPENRLLWRFNRRRLEGETVWDALHSVAGTINLEQGGPPVMPPISDEERSAMREPYRWQESPDPKQHTRRGLYVMAYRNFRFPLFDVFDAPNNSVSVGNRDVSTVAPQALWLLNHPIAWQQAQKLAERVERESPANTSDRIHRLWRLTLQRSPTDAERQSAEKLLAGATSLAQLSLTLFNHNEFLFVD